MPNTDKPSIINCHTHIFTGDHVPPWLARTFLPLFFYRFLPLSGVVSLFRWYYRRVDPIQYKNWYKNWQRRRRRLKNISNRYGVFTALYWGVGLWLTAQVFFILVEWFSTVFPLRPNMDESINGLREFIDELGLLWIPTSLFGQILLTVGLIIIFTPGRNLLFFLLRSLWSFLGKLPGKESKALAERYINLGRFAFYRDQFRIYGRLRSQYPPGTGFLVLPMDMAYMGAGTPKCSYRKQMEGLRDIKANPKYRDQFFPFVFADPRRIVAEKDNPGGTEDKKYFDYRVEQGKMILEDCFVREYIEEHRFNGFKIYPALGYYPFAEALLPVWKYAADHQLPILTHCIKGTIYYRGPKKKAWELHPVFEEPAGGGSYRPLELPERQNSLFSLNFTHPLNYLALLDESLLRRLVAEAEDDKIRNLFGYTDMDTPLRHDLSQLKICFGHFGGEDQWKLFLERDRDSWSRQLVEKPEHGIHFLTNEEGDPRPGKISQVWRYTDWYSIVCSIMLQYPNVYADLSYILHDPQIESLLKQTLRNPKLRERVLFGTDFYVVRNHKSEKNMLFDLQGYLPEAEFDQIARTNPRAYLYSALHGRV